jgi:hypothetical protein
MYVRQTGERNLDVQVKGGQAKGKTMDFEGPQATLQKSKLL